MDSDSIEDYLSQNSDMDPIEDDSDAIYEEELEEPHMRSSKSLNSISESEDVKARNRSSMLDTIVIAEPSVSEQSRVLNASNRIPMPDTTTTEVLKTSATATTTQKKLIGVSSSSKGSASKKAVLSVKTNSDNSAAGMNEKVVNVNSTKIIIKGISTMANAGNTVVSVDEEVKNIFPQEKMGMQTEIDLQVKDFDDKVSETDRQETSTPKIKREIKQLQKMVNESKILTDFINEQDSQRSRKVKRTLKTDTDHDFSGAGGDNESIASKSSSRSRSLSRNLSPIDTPVSSKDSEKNRRNMRSQNAEFSAKHYKFLRGIQQHDSDASDNTSDIEVEKPVSVNSTFEEKPKAVHPPPKPGWDKFCWACHLDNCTLPCSNCKRCYHTECMKVKQTPKTESDLAVWKCPECVFVETAELNYRNDSRPKYKLDQLCTMLRFALKRFTQLNGAKTFMFPNDASYIVNEMNFNIIKTKIDAKLYPTTEAFTSDVKWILHNCIISQYRGTKFLAVAKIILKICKQEMYDIETCPECYFNANIRKSSWFVEVCSRPHILLWAKLKGFPYWPAKAMGLNSAALVDVRFFGDHDRAWVPIRDCYLFSEADPNPATNKFKRHSIADSLKEVAVYVEHITAKFGSFVYAPFKCPYDPNIEGEQLEKMIPGIGKILKGSSNNKSDLTYKIVKSADNNHSIVKKIESKIKGENDETKKSPEAVTVTDLKKKVGRPSVTVSSPDSTVPRQYHVMRRTSNVRAEDRAKVKVVILKRKISLPSSFSTDKSDSIPRNKKRCSQSIALTDLKSSVEPTKPTKSDNVDSDVSDISKKMSNPPTKSPVVLIGIMPDANQLLKDNKSVSPKPSQEVNDHRTDNNVDAISVPLESATPCGEFSTGKDHLNNSTEVIEPMVSKTIAPATDNQPTVDNPLIPLEDVKKEVMSVDDDDTDDTSNKSPETTQRNNDQLDLDATIKTEPMSVDDDTESVPFSNGIETSANTPVLEKTPAELFITRGNITVKDISKLKNPGNPSLKTQFLNLRTLKKTVLSKVVGASKIDQRARKSFPSGITVSSTRTGLINNTESNLNNTGSMVYIPMKDAKLYNNATSILSVAHGGSTGGDISTPATSKTTPPPLTSVSVGPKHVQTAPQNSQSSNQSSIVNVPPSSMNFLTSCPPPLTLSSSIPLANVYTMVSMPSVSLAPAITPTFQPQHHEGFVTENLAAAVTETIARAPPRLLAKPTGALRSDGTGQLHSIAGSASSTLSDNSHKLADFFRSVIEDTLSDLAANNSLEAKVKLLQLEIEKLKFVHSKEISDLKTNTDLILCEMKKSLDNERTRLINETRKQCEQERIRSVDETKKKQWCINCGKEAQFYCCWNTSYCDYPCQQQHWLRHMANCAQNGDVNVDPNAKKIGIKVVQMKDKPHMTVASKMMTPALAPRIISSNIRVAGNKNASTMQRMIPIVQPRGSAVCYVNRQRMVVSSTSSTITPQKNIISNTFIPGSLVINAAPLHTNAQSNAESIRITPD